MSAMSRSASGVRGRSAAAAVGDTFSAVSSFSSSMPRELLRFFGRLPMTLFLRPRKLEPLTALARTMCVHSKQLVKWH